MADNSTSTGVLDELERAMRRAYRNRAGGPVLDGDAVGYAGAGEDDDGETRARALVTGGDPDARAQLPGPAAFTNPARDLTDYAPAPDVERVADALIARCRDLHFLRDVRVRYLWRRKAQAKNGTMILGTCQKLSGLPQYALGGGDFLIIINRENCGLAGLTAWQLEALIYHEMNHIAPPNEDDPEGTVGLCGHDVEEFRAVIDRYGLWKTDLREVAPAFVQAKIAGL